MSMNRIGDSVLLKPSALREDYNPFGTIINIDDGKVVVGLESGQTVAQFGTGWFENIEHINDAPDDTMESNATIGEPPMSNPSTPSETPNVIITNPTIRKWVGNILGAATVILSIATVVDGAIAEVDYANVTGPAAIIIAGILGIFQITVTSANIPKQ